MQRALFLLMVACFALASCKDVNLGADGVDAGGRSGGSSGSTGGTTGTGGAGGTGACPAGQTLCTACGTSFCADACPTVKCGTGGSGGTTGATGGTTSSPPNCAMVGCSQPPLCSEGCTAPCGCCPCATGTRNGDLICTKSGCYDWAAAPDAAGLDQAVDMPQTDAQRGGAGGSGGTIGTGGSMQTGGTTASPPVDAGANSCSNPLPLQCGDRLNHSTLIQGRASVWSGYACSQRAESGREAIYALQTPAACQVAVQLKNLTVDLDLFVLTGCAPGPYDKCSSTPLDLQTIETVNFTSQAGQPYFVVVDGYSDAAGTYTLQVDCTCNPDAGTSDAPLADAPGDGAIAGCDPTEASKTLAALGIVSAGDPQMLSTTLPTDLATDANWGIKARVCKQAGYDISALAGKTVCLYEQDMNQMCQGIPGTAWVVMNNGTVACVYKTIRNGLAAIAPGVYAANDANCTPPVIAPGATVTCEGASCTNATGPCCPATSTMNRVGMCWSDCSVTVTCDGPEDCSNGSVCCSFESAAGLAGAACTKADQCLAPSRVICRQRTDCLASQKCGKPDPMPAFISVYPYAETSTWRVDYQVCAP